MDGSRNCRSVCWTRYVTHSKGDDYRRLTLGVAGWMRYVGGVDEQGKPLMSSIRCLHSIQAIHQQYQTPEERVRGLLAIESIFGNDLPKNHDLCKRYRRLPTAIAKRRESHGRSAGKVGR